MLSPTSISLLRGNIMGFGIVELSLPLKTGLILK